MHHCRDGDGKSASGMSSKWVRQTKCVLANVGSAVFDVKWSCIWGLLLVCQFIWLYSGGFEYLNEAEQANYFGRRPVVLPPLRITALSLLSLWSTCCLTSSDLSFLSSMEMEAILKRGSSLSRLWLMNKGVWKMTECASFSLAALLHIGWWQWLWARTCHVLYTCFLCCVKRNKKSGTKQPSEILRFGKHCKIILMDKQHSLCLKILEDEHKRKNKWEAIPQALHIQSVPGHLVSTLSPQQPVRMHLKWEVSKTWLGRAKRHSSKMLMYAWEGLLER